MHFVSELNPFLWADESSADPAYYEEFKSFMKDKTIDSDMGYSLALEFLSNDIYYSKVPEYFKKQVLMNGFLLQRNIYQNHIKVMASKKR